MSVKGPIFILSIDGGGSRGAIPANFLYFLEQDAAIPVRATFDFFAGVSTGALVAAYCAANVGSMESLAKESYSSGTMSRIFDKSVWDRMLGRMQNQPKYDGTHKRRYLEDVVGHLRINDIRDRHLLILAYDFINRELVTYKNNRGHDAGHNPSLAEVCDAATAAPTLYPTVATSTSERRWFIDGALAVNDPSLCAIAEALSMGHVLTDIWMLSVGTGQPARDLPQEQQDRIGAASQSWGVMGWVANGLLDHMLSASSCVSAHQCQALLGERYVRVNGQLPRHLMQLDNTSEARVSDFEGCASVWFEESLEAVRDLVERVWTARRAYAAEALVADPGFY